MRTQCYYLIITVFLTLSLCAQSLKKTVTQDDYDKWGTLTNIILSPDGKWASCRMEHQSGNDTLSVINVITGKEYKFAKAISAKFSPNSKYIAIYFPKNDLQLIDVNTLKTTAYIGIVKFDFLLNDKYVLIRKKQNNMFEIQLMNFKNEVLWLNKNVTDYCISIDDKLAIVTNQNVSIVQIKQKIKVMEIYKDSTAITSKATWSDSGNSLAFFRTPKDSTGLTIVHYNLKNKFLQIINKNLLDKDMQIANHGIVISKTDDKLYFNIIASKKEKKEKIVEAWDSLTLLEYPEQILYEDPDTNPILTAWALESGKLQRINNDNFSNSKILPGGKYVLSQSKSSIVEQYDEIPPVDYYSSTIDSDQKNLIVLQGSRSAGAIKVSPSGQYISYFKNGDYYVFDNSLAKSTNITSNRSIDFLNSDNDRAGTNPGYYSPGWTSDSKFIILYDEFDIWLFSYDGKSARRITDGRKNRIRYRLVLDIEKRKKENIAELSSDDISLENGILLYASGYDKSSGYYTFDKLHGIRKLIYGKSKCSKIMKDANNQIFLYSEETDTIPPRLMIQNYKNKPRMVFQSNVHYHSYEWSRSQLITYNNSKGDSLQAILMYPAGYNPLLKYPMIVYIYEKLSYSLYEYRNPVLRHHIGFSPTNYLLDGYIVLMPDIKYELGNPGISSTDCVISSVNKVKQMGILEENHIGLVGHSYGGYEVSFIVTQTPIFAAAVSGAAITDIVSWYLTMNFNKFRSNAWFFESQQLRMGSSPFNNWSGYTRNSAIANASNINTPILIWSGKNDTSVNVEQSIELHLSLRRLQKTSTMFLYPNQGHILTDPDAQLHLTESVKEWFNKYLKVKN